MPMNLEDLEEVLAGVKQGQGARVSYDTFERIFPPGVEHDPSKEAAYELATKHGLKIENRPDDSAVWFFRE